MAKISKSFFEHELERAEQEVFDKILAAIVFLHNNDVDLDTIRNMLMDTVDNALDQYERKIK